MSLPKPAGVILAGGRSSRMGTGHKALFEFQGQPLLRRVIDSLKPYLEPLMLSCDSGNKQLNYFGLPLVPDLLPGFKGPQPWHPGWPARQAHDVAVHQPR